MKEVVLKNNSQSSIEVPLYEKVPVVTVKAVKRCILEPGEEVTLGCEVPTDRIRHYEQFGTIDVDLEYREPAVIPECVECTGVRASGGKGAKIVKYVDRNYITVKFNEATIKDAVNPFGKKAYWMGILIAAPEGAASLVRSWGKTQNALDNNYKEPVLAEDFDKKVLNGKDGWYYYANAGAQEPLQWFRTEWLAADGSIIEENDYYLDFSELTLI